MSATDIRDRAHIETDRPAGYLQPNCPISRTEADGNPAHQSPSDDLARTAAEAEEHTRQGRPPLIDPTATNAR